MNSTIGRLYPSTLDEGKEMGSYTDVLINRNRHLLPSSLFKKEDNNNILQAQRQDQKAFILPIKSMSINSTRGDSANRESTPGDILGQHFNNLDINNREETNSPQFRKVPRQHHGTEFSRLGVDSKLDSRPNIDHFLVIKATATSYAIDSKNQSSILGKERVQSVDTINKQEKHAPLSVENSHRRIPIIPSSLTAIARATRESVARVVGVRRTMINDRNSTDDSRQIHSIFTRQRHPSDINDGQASSYYQYYKQLYKDVTQQHPSSRPSIQPGMPAYLTEQAENIRIGLAKPTIDVLIEPRSERFNTELRDEINIEKLNSDSKVPIGRSSLSTWKDHTLNGKALEPSPQQNARGILALRGSLLKNTGIPHFIPNQLQSEVGQSSIQKFPDIEGLLTQLNEMQAERDKMVKQREETEAYYKNLIMKISSGRDRSCGVTERGLDTGRTSVNEGRGNGSPRPGFKIDNIIPKLQIVQLGQDNQQEPWEDSITKSKLQRLKELEIDNSALRTRINELETKAVRSHEKYKKLYEKYTKLKKETVRQTVLQQEAPMSYRQIDLTQSSSTIRKQVTPKGQCKKNIYSKKRTSIICSQGSQKDIFLPAESYKIEYSMASSHDSLDHLDADINQIESMEFLPVLKSESHTRKLSRGDSNQAVANEYIRTIKHQNSFKINETKMKDN